jgi:hypothetical protein
VYEVARNINVMTNSYSVLIRPTAGTTSGMIGQHLIGLVAILSRTMIMFVFQVKLCSGVIEFEAFALSDEAHAINSVEVILE